MTAALDIVDLLGRLGLAWYAQALDDPDPALAAIRQDGEAAAREAGLADLAWPGQKAEIAARWRGAEGPLPRLARALGLTQADLFLLGLALGCERRRPVALAVMALQAPLATARPTVHLALELSEALFAAPGEASGDALSLADGPLLAGGLVEFSGADALPNRLLTAHLPLWRALGGGAPAWPGCRPLPEPEAAPWPDLDRAAALIGAGEADGLVLRGPPGSGRAGWAAVLARKIGLASIEVPLPLFRDDRAFAAACRACGWLPVLRVEAEYAQAASLDNPQALPYAALVSGGGAVLAERPVELTLAPPPRGERVALWRGALGSDGEFLTEAAADALLYPAAIKGLARDAKMRAQTEGRAVSAEDIVAARLAAAPRALWRLAQPVTRRVDGAALVRPPGLARELAALIARCRSREAIWDGLGPAMRAGFTRGVRALFAGESGAGKTFAASYIAGQLGAPLFRCDLAAVMNKYIGESEKNLDALLDHAEAADVILLFDEADALFGRRSDGGETGERYANMLTNYLLTRLETHQGLVILTTNARGRIDPAFWRRLDLAIDFPAPGYEERLALWRAHLGARAPEAAVLERLAAYCDLPGGGVRNVVLAAAALAPAGAAIGLELLSPALRREYSKLKRNPPANLALALRAVE